MMNYLLAAAALAVPVAAGAAPRAAAEAEVEWRNGAHDKVIVDQTIWRCEGNLCRGDVVEHSTTKLRTCLKLAGFAGRVVAFRTSSGSLGADDLARCNRGR